MVWNLDNSLETPAGQVAWGCAGSGPPLVLAHGWPWSSFSWHRIIPALAEDFRVYWYDMPGYGRSGMRQEQRTGLDVQGETFAFMLDHWGLNHRNPIHRGHNNGEANHGEVNHEGANHEGGGRPSVIAHDFGGATTLRAHLLHGCDYDRYVLMNVVAMRPWGSAFFDHVGRHVAAFTGLPPHIHAAVVRAYIGGALISDLDASDLDALAAPWLTEAGRGSFYRQFAEADERFTAEVEPMFGDLRCPTMILWGREDPWIPLDRARALHQTMPTARFETMPGLGHLPQLEAPDMVLDRIRGFLGG